MPRRARWVEQVQKVKTPSHAPTPRAAAIRARIAELPVIDQPPDDDEDEAEDDGPITDPPTDDAPDSWYSESLDLLAASIRLHLGPLKIPEYTIEQVAAALSSGKHLLLVGPPGTGKTELAVALADTARSEGYCAGIFSATASADWTTYETVGGYALQRDGSLRFQPGVFLRAIAAQKWLLIDELNRADIDRSFGELMTVLSGKGTDTAFDLDDGRTVSIGPELERAYRVPPTFRVLATMNSWDKTSLFRLSYAVQRRFAIVHLGVPDDGIYEAILQTAAQKPGLDPVLPSAESKLLIRWFHSKALLAWRAVGPAVPLDMIRYARRRAAGGDGLAEATMLYLLPQLEGSEDPRFRAQVGERASARPVRVHEKHFVRPTRSRGDQPGGGSSEWGRDQVRAHAISIRPSPAEWQPARLHAHPLDPPRCWRAAHRLVAQVVALDGVVPHAGPALLEHGRWRGRRHAEGSQLAGTASVLGSASSPSRSRRPSVVDSRAGGAR